MVAKDSEQYGPEESRKRFEDALKGARLAGHRPMESLIRKKKAKPKKRPGK
jgi:hypothetical protein